ncbi:hypothetical protein OIO90_005899 [Microbotryomycetes sp. JL221]|nr:hypothetical protein OIO90_005899 [Microbotryomycetes sp. JL221]
MDDHSKGITDTPNFKHELIGEIFKLEQDKSTFNPESVLRLSAEYLRLLTVEAVHRSAQVFHNDQTTNPEPQPGPQLLEVKHLQNIIAGLLLDFD